MVSLQAALAVVALSGVGQTVLLDFYTDWCGPCRMMDPTVRQLAAQGYPVRQVNVDQDRALAAKFQVQNIPCFVMLVDGREVDRVVGATSIQRLAQMCKAGLPSGWQNQTPVALASAAAAQGGAIAAAPMPSGPVLSQARPPAPAVSAASSLPAAAGSGWRLSDPQPAATIGRLRPDAELIAASVRLRIEDPQGRSLGSGTIIDTRQGEALILTCGHIFRDSQGKGPIEVDLFGPQPAQRIPGRLICYDLERDVGLVSIRVPGPVVVAPVAPPGYQTRTGDPILSVGCDNGSQPSVRHARVTAVGKYLGPPNLQVADVPVVGRSGGGLFTPDGLVIGVCNAADPTDQAGFYAALGSIHAELDRAGLSYLYRPQPAAVSPETALASADPPVMPKQMPRPSDLPPTASLPLPTASAAAGDPAGPNKEEQALLEEIHQRLSEGAEVICIIRPRRNPQARSEVVMLERASAALLERLAAEARADEPRHLTSLELPRGQAAAATPGLTPRARQEMSPRPPGGP